jgi:Dolichyl-phosphate-mannose-protein mannosyltransferase
LTFPEGLPDFAQRHSEFPPRVKGPSHRFSPIPSKGYLLPGILLLALLLRLFGLVQQSLSMDEVAELNIAGISIKKIVFVRDGFPPLYHTLLHGWLMLFPGDTAARALSALLGTVSVGAIWGFARRVGGSRIALWAALLVAVSPFHIWHSQEARAYILYYLFAALALWSLFAALQTDERRAWASYIASSFAGLLTHYYFGLLLLSNAFLLLIELPRHQRRRGILAHLVLMLLSIPVLALLRGDLSAESSAPFALGFEPAGIGYTFFSFIGGYAVGPSPRELHELTAGRAITEMLPWLLVIGAAVTVLLYYGLQRLGPRLWLPRLLVLTVLPVAASVLIAGLMGITFQARHVLWASIPLFVVLGAGASDFRTHRTAALALASLVLVFSISRYHRYFVAGYQTEDLRSLAAYLQRTSPSLPVFVLSGYMAEPLRHYLDDRWRIYPLPDAGRSEVSQKQALRYLRSRLRPGSRFWMAYTREFHGDPEGQFVGELTRDGLIRRTARFPGVVLYQGKAE